MDNRKICDIIEILITVPYSPPRPDTPPTPPDEWDIDWDNKEFPFSGIRILTTNSKVHDEMVKILNKEKFKAFYI